VFSRNAECLRDGSVHAFGVAARDQQQTQKRSDLLGRKRGTNKKQHRGRFGTLKKT
jgi:hypothetical protein